LAERAQAGTLPRPARPETGSAAKVRATAAPLLGLVCLAEVVFLVGGLVAGAVAGLVALSACLVVGWAWRQRPEGQIAIALSILPLLRTLSIALPSVLVPVWIWHAEIGLAVIVATFLAARVIGLSAADLGLRTAPPRDTALALAIGFPLGFLGATITDPASILPDRSLATAATASVAVIVGAAVAEELLFRGLLLRLAERVRLADGVVVTSALSTLLYVATLNVQYVALMGLVSVVLAILTLRSNSIWPAIACHAALAWSQLILWPALAG